LEVIPTGVDVAGIRALTPIDPRVAATWPADAIVVASLGRLAPEKSPETVLDALAVAARREPRFRLLVIGGGPSEAKLRARASQADLAGRVDFSGALPRIEALARLAGCDIFAFASRTETQGLVLAEALACGLPAVAVDGPGVRDSLREGVDGRIVEAEPADGRAQRLGSALAEVAGSDDDRDRMAEEARSGAERFALERRIGEVEALYRSILG